MDRYIRNVLIEGFGKEGQDKLRNSKVLVVGAGGLGSPVLLYLAAAGIGTLGIADNDRVELSNLQRQIIHFTGNVGEEKIVSATDKLHCLNPEVEIITYPERLDAGNADLLVTPYDFVVDCTDNYATKFLINDLCVKHRKPFSHAAVAGLRGEVMTYTPGNACYRCVFGEPPADTAERNPVGVLGAMAGMLGTIQATEAIKYLTGIGDLLTNRILIVDGSTMDFRSVRVKKNSKCRCDKDGT